MTFHFPSCVNFNDSILLLSPTTFHGQLLPGGREQTHLLTIHDDCLNGAQVCCIGLRPLLHEASWIASSTGLPAFPHAPFSVCLFISSFRLQCNCSHEIKRCLLLGRKAMTKLDSILKSSDITLPTKACIVKVMVFPIVMYRCESWTIKKAEH